jgi:hypothetical protein
VTVQNGTCEIFGQVAQSLSKHGNSVEDQSSFQLKLPSCDEAQMNVFVDLVFVKLEAHGSDLLGVRVNEAHLKYVLVK